MGLGHPDLRLSLTSAAVLGRRGGAPAPTPAPEPVAMVVFAGQSNANSHGTTGGDVPPALQGPMEGVFTWDPAGGRWLTYQAGTGGNSMVHLGLGGVQYWGPEAEFARRWKAARPGVPLYMVKKGHGGTFLAPQGSGTADWSPSSSGEHYDALKASVAAAKASLVAMGKAPEVRAFVWIQGESDALDAGAAGAYEGYLGGFVDAVRAEMIGPAAPFLIVRIADIANWTYRAQVRAAQVATAYAKPGCRWVDAGGIGVAPDGIHYHPPALVELGKRIWDAQLTGAEIAAAYVARMAVPPPEGREALLAGLLFEPLATKGVWPQIADLKLLASHDAQSALLNAKSASFAGVNQGMAFAADRGFTGNGGGAYIDTGLVPASADGVIRQSSSAWSYFVCGNAQDAGHDMGSIVGGWTTFLARYTGNQAYFRVNTANVGPENTLNVTDASGLWSFIRSAANAQQAFRNGAALEGVDSVHLAEALPTGAMYLGARNGGGPSTSRQYALVAQGGARDAVQEAAFAEAVAAYLAAIGTG